MSIDANAGNPANPNPEEKDQVLDETGKPVDQGNDPLDLITDPKVAIAEAKKYRAIASRKGSKETPAPKVPADPVTPAVVPKPDSAGFITKEDMAKRTTRDAKKIAPKEVQDNWNELLSIPLAGFDPLDAESIVENMKSRLAILNARKGKDSKPDTTDLTTTKTNPTGQAPAGGAPKVELPRFTQPKQPKDWYTPKP